MKNIFFLLLLLPAIARAQYDLTFKDIAGKWVERTRTDKNSDVTPFKDTLYLELRADGFMLLRHTIGPTVSGYAELAENKLILDKDIFSIERAEGDILKLKQKNTMHRFVKQETFPDAPIAKTAPALEQGDIISNPARLIGKWSVYKKTDAAFTGSTFYIKTLDIREMNRENTFKGAVTFHNMESVYSDDAIITMYQNEFHIVGAHKVIKARVIKNDGGEMVLEHGTVTYFMKRFGP